MALTVAPSPVRRSSRQRSIAIDVKIAATTEVAPTPEQRQRDLARLVILAACRRAARQGSPAGRLDPPGGPAADHGYCE